VVVDPKRFAPIPYEGDMPVRNRTNRIVIHCLDTPKGWKEDIREIDRWHREERGWSYIGYHFIIFRDGTIVQGRPVEAIGAHQPGWNTNSVAIALSGGKSAKEDDEFLKHFTVVQGEMLDTLIRSLLIRYPGATVSGHTDHPKCDKACPGFNVKSWWSGRKTPK
jgi:N-acetylmuramoyl-L-alanine amidase